MLTQVIMSVTYKKGSLVLLTDGPVFALRDITLHTSFLTGFLQTGRTM